nr:MFS transporter [Solicola gregarius]
MCLALAVVVGMMTSLMVAVPDIATDLRASESELQWVVNAYGVTFAGLLLVSGAIGDRLGRKAVLVGGLTIFGVASAGILIVDDVRWLIALRAVAGVGASAVMPMTLSIISHVFPPQERGRAIGVWSGVTVGGGLIGLLTAGGLLELFSWRSVFVVNIGLTVAALLGACAVPRQARSGAGRVDVGGGVLSVIAVAALVFGILRGPEAGWDAASVLVAFAVAVGAGIAFAWWELGHVNPVLDPRVFRVHALTSGSLIIAAESLAMFGFFFIGLQYLQVIKEYSPLTAAVAMLPLAVAAMVFSPVVPRVVTRWGYRPTVTTGMAMIAVGLMVMSRLSISSGYTPIAIGTFLLGAGIAFAATPATEAIMAALPPDKQGVASALNDVTRELGGVLGIAMLGSIFNDVYRSNVGAAAARLPADLATATKDSTSAGLAIASAPNSPSGLTAAVVNSFESAMSAAMLGGVIVVVAGAILALAIVRSSRHSDAGPQGSDGA